VRPRASALEVVLESVVTDGRPWGLGLGATPALAHGMLYLPTHHDALFAVELASGRIRWRHEADESPIYPRHYTSIARSFASSPIVIGDLVWSAAPT